MRRAFVEKNMPLFGRVQLANRWPSCELPPALIKLDSVSLRHGRQILFVDVSMNVFRGERVGLIGPNGAGKSTVFRLLVGNEQADGGRVVVERGVEVGYFSQDVGEMSGRSVLDETTAGAGEVAECSHRLRELEQAMSDPASAGRMDDIIAEFGEVQARFDELGGYALEARAREILAGLSFRAEVVDEDVGNLSGGWKMRVALARILLKRPDVLLLDEPTNHLDLESIIWLEQFLKSFDGALVLTSHDREFLNRIVTKIADIDGGNIQEYSGNYDFYEEQRALVAGQAEARYERQQAMLAKEERFISRFRAQANKASAVQSRIKKLEKIERLDPPKTHSRRRFKFQPAPRSGDDVVLLEQVNKRYGDQVIYDDFNLLVRRGERVSVLGANGAGKSTLLKLIAGESGPDSGELRIGAGVKPAYFAQHTMEVLDPALTVYQTLEADFPTVSVGTLRTLAGAFGFSGDEVDKPCDVLSGGERARLVLARLLYDPPNLLIFDEPTNHLDMETKEMLVDALREYTGTMVFVSHDRNFLSALSTRVLEITPGEVHSFDGGYDEYVAASGHEAPGLHA